MWKKCEVGGGGGVVAKSCPTLANPWTVACKVPLSMGVLQARILEWVAISSSRGSGSTMKKESLKRCVIVLHLWVHSSAWATLRWQEWNPFWLRVSQHNLCINNWIIIKQQSWMKRPQESNQEETQRKSLIYLRLYTVLQFKVRQVTGLLKENKQNKTNNLPKNKTEASVTTWYYLIFKQKI